MLNRELDGKIVKDVFGWDYVHIGKDYNGENECEILWKYDKIEQEVCNRLPFSGKIHEAFLAPSYSNNLYEALNLAKHVGLNISIKDLPLNPEKIAELSYNYFLETKTKIDRIDNIIKVLKEKYPKVDFVNSMTGETVNGEKYSILAYNVKFNKKDRTEFNKSISDIYNKLIENNEELPLFIPFQEKRKKTK